MIIEDLKAEVAKFFPGATVNQLVTKSGKSKRRHGRYVLAEILVPCGRNSWWSLYVDHDGVPVFHPGRRPESHKLADNLLRMRTELIETIEKLRGVIGAD